MHLVFLDRSGRELTDLLVQTLYFVDEAAEEGQMTYLSTQT